MGQLHELEGMYICPMSEGAQEEERQLRIEREHWQEQEKERANKRIITLATMLVDTLIKAGYDVRTKINPDGYSNITVSIWDKQEIEVQNILRGWKIQGEYYPAQPE